MWIRDDHPQRAGVDNLESRVYIPAVLVNMENIKVFSVMKKTMKWQVLLSSVVAALGANTTEFNGIRSLADETWTVTNEHGNITVPGKYPSYVHLDLYAAKVIDDPYHGLGDLDLRWIAAQNWTYTSKPVHGLSKDKAVSTWLVFDGLDTYSTIKFCDRIVATTDNQFKQWSFDVSSALNACHGDPVLSINFGSVPAIINTLNASGIESTTLKPSLFVRCLH